MEYRNARIIWDNLINCEINHPTLGWIPFTANPNDTNAAFDVVALHQTMSEDPETIPWDGQPPPALVPASITRRQCAIQLMVLGIINGDEAVAMAQNGTPPIAVQTYLDALPTETERVMAKIDFAASNYYRSNPLIDAILAASGYTPEQGDQFFIDAENL